MRRWLLVLLPALLLLLGSRSAYGAPASALTDGAQPQTFGIQPATATDPDGRGTFGYSATPGALVKDHVAVWNYSEQPITLRLYAADAFNTDTGGYDVLPEGKPSTQAGSWLRTSVASLELPARSRQIVPFTLAVPADAAPGDHAAGIVASLRRETKDAQGNTVTVDQRVGSRVNIRVAGDLRPELTVVGATALYHPSANPFATGRTTVRYTVRNTGNVRLGGKQAVRVTNVLGTVATGGAPADLQELLPGNSVDYRVEVSGAYPTLLGTAGVTIDPLPIGGDRDPGLSSTVHKQRFVAVPWTMLLLLLVVAGLAALWWSRRRTRRRLLALPPLPIGAVTAGAALAAVLLLTQLPYAPTAFADTGSNGTLAFDYPTGHDDDAIDLLTSGPCPDPAADYLGVRITGRGFPAEGVPLTGTTAVSAYRPAGNGGFVVPLANTLRVVANRSGLAALSGPYTITASCRGKVNPAPLREFSGVVTFSSPSTWTAAAVAPDGMIHAAGSDPVPVAARAPKPAAQPASAARSGPSLGSWLAIGAGVVLLGWVGVPYLRRRFGRSPASAGAAAAAGPVAGEPGTAPAAERSEVVG
ncbi:hypothetical protein [Kitasatospora cinereorecta]|uniref:DUF916 domain-containing protein n=1 Tax=Kitasatospora cinereorecta TaxID=285560 RepID=A0ABW0VAJ3_9ACTN